MINSILHLFQDTVNCIPCDTREAYTDALARAPDVVADETDPINYMLFDEFNVWAAANRIIQYWQWKKRLFGDRMFLPLHDLSGAGALDEEDIAYLYTGYGANLPPQKDGISVILADRSRVDWDSMDPIRHLRVVLFCMSIAAKEQQEFFPTTKQRFVIVVNIVTSIPNTKKTHNYGDLGRVVECIPIHVKCIRTLLVTRMAFVDYVLKIVLPIVAKYTEDMMTNIFESIDLVYSNDCIRERLEAYELEPEGVPPTLGGTWEYRSYFDMLRRLSSVTVVSSFKTPTSCTAASRSKQELDYRKEPHLPSFPSEDRVDTIQGTFPDLVSVSLPPSIPGPLNDVLNSKGRSFAKTWDGIGNGCSVTTYPFDQFQTLYFLRHDDFDRQRCAFHTKLYLEVRKMLFSERATLPMSQIDGGALSFEDRMTLDTGFILIAPRSRGGDFIVALEPYLAIGSSTCSQRRCYFYILNILLEQIKTGREKLVILLVLSKLQPTHISKSACYADIAKAFPLEVSYLHVFLKPGYHMYKSCIDDLLTNILDIDHNQVIRHTIQGCMESLALLYDLEAKHLPISIGGELNAEYFRLWQKQRQQIEWERKCREHCNVVATLSTEPDLQGSKLSTSFEYNAHLAETNTYKQSISRNRASSVLCFDPNLSTEVEALCQPNLVSGISIVECTVPSCTQHLAKNDVEKEDDDISINCLDFETDSIYSINTQLFDDDIAASVELSHAGVCK